LRYAYASGVTRFLAICGFLLLGLFSSCWAGQSCTPGAVQRSVAEAKAIQSRLLANNVKDMDPEVSGAIQQQIRAIKEALATTVDTYMRCQGKNEIKARQLQNELAVLLGANAPEKPRQYTPENTSLMDDQVYGGDLKVAVARPVNESQLMAVELSFGIECGDDTILLIYEQNNGVWHRSVRWNSDDYGEISGAFGDFFQYVVMPSGPPMGWVVAVAHGHPWCTSRWSAFDLDVIEPAQGTATQRLLFHKQDGYVRETDPVMKVKSDGFELRFEKGCLDLGIMTRSGIYRYQFVGDQMHRVQPVAMNGRDFVDEWLQTEWSDAAQWSETSKLKELEAKHAGFLQLRSPEAKGGPLFSYGPVRACSDDAKRFVVELDQDPGTPTYFQVQQGENSFTMRAISHIPFPQCKGPDLMRTR
jgi:hypothetical protein